MKSTPEDLLEIVRISIKNIKCQECGKYPQAILTSEKVEFEISCNKNCDNKKKLQTIIDETSVRVFEHYYKQ